MTTYVLVGVGGATGAVGTGAVETAGAVGTGAKVTGEEDGSLGAETHPPFPGDLVPFPPRPLPLPGDLVPFPPRTASL